ncbi:glycosyltransferase family 4 protein [Simiduia agarivorans]|uniref:Glycosyltransferase-like protein n=1 Tax=Simiduia agarivorans (strain DSM 21679 / JCM 13881 / BCRC 17597 / SA1) TaxID=1117647 RepID=K4KL36_SIMAS|nr:glycosyltransferase family 4 protein [Simiduia agarivorans]AFU98945.2 glycosyltransferase-like protein [Simiduia agarivorans SA1 = DSM 21679]
MIIGHFIETEHPGGAEQVLLDICERLPEKGCTPVLFHFSHPWLASECEKRGISQVPIPFPKLFKKSYLLPIFAVRMAKLLKFHKVDVLHSHLFGPIVGGSLAAKLAGIRHIGTLHDTYMIEEKPSRIQQIKLASVLGSQLVAVSRSMQDFYISRLNRGKRAVGCIYNGIDLQEFEPTPAKRRTLKFICVGRLVPLKQVEKVAETFIQLARDYDVSLTIIGGGDTAIKQRLEKLQHANPQLNIELAGQQSNVSKWLTESDIFVQYSTTEGLSRSIIEATAAGLPCIVSNVGGNSEIVENGINGFLVDPDNSDELINAMKKLCNSPELRNRFSVASRQIAKERFSAPSTQAQYQSLYGISND